MPAVLALIGILLGTAAPASFAAITAVQWTQLSIVLAGGVPKVIAADHNIIVFLQSPAFRAWAAANGEQAIRLQPGLIKER